MQRRHPVLGDDVVQRRLQVTRQARKLGQPAFDFLPDARFVEAGAHATKLDTSGTEPVPCAPSRALAAELAEDDQLAEVAMSRLYRRGGKPISALGNWDPPSAVQDAERYGNESACREIPAASASSPLVSASRSRNSSSANCLGSTRRLAAGFARRAFRLFTFLATTAKR